jgi:hypothetical protein
VIIVIVVLVAIALFLRSRSGGLPQRSVAGAIATDAPSLAQVDFKVEGTTAHVYFDTTIPPSGADDVLAGLMGREAMKIFQGKANHLPLDGVKHVAAHGRQGGQSVLVKKQDVHRPAEMDHMDEPRPAVRASDVHPGDEDPLAALHAMDFGRGAGYRGGSDDLPALADELKIPAKVVAAIAGEGGSVAGMSLEQLIAGMLRQSGYDVTLAGDGTGTARRSGAATFLQFVEHETGGYPELGESAVDSFVRKFIASGAQRGMLFTPKFGPYAIYERERRNDKIKFMTRERLQAFVDGVAMG